MRRIDKLSRAQRVVVVVALGVAFLAVGNSLLSAGQPVVGWTEPLVPAGIGQPDWAALVTWLVLACLWAIVSIRLLRPSGPDESD